MKARERAALDAVVTSAEAAELLGFTKPRVHQLVDAGILAGRRATVKAGERGTLLILRSSVEAFDRKREGKR